MIFTCTLQVAPHGKGRPRFTKQGHAYTPAKTVAKEAEIKYWLIQEGAPKFEGALSMNVRIYLKRPKSGPKNRIFPCVRPDLDNYLKSVLDAGNGVLFNDDAQVVRCMISKEYGDPERIELTVMNAGGDLYASP